MRQVLFLRENYSLLGCVAQLLKRLLPFALLWTGAGTALAQTSVGELRKFLGDKAAFQTEDFTTLEKGQVVAKLLPAKDKREIDALGVFHTSVSADIFLQRYRKRITHNLSENLIQAGKFSNPPSPDDLRALVLDPRDIEDIKKCESGNCDLKLSDAMIERLQKEVNWSASDYRAQVNNLFRQILLDYVRDYLTRGDAALVEYHDQSRPLRLADETRSLLDGSPYVNEYAPEFSKYLKGFPAAELPGAENFIYWSILKFGFKPVVAITHITIYPRQQGNASQVLVAEKQIYADHYFDSSLALTVFTAFPKSAGSDSYLLYMNSSRADALTGAFGKLRRLVIKGEALDGLKTNLYITKRHLETDSENQTDSPPPPSSTPFGTGGIVLISAVLGAALIVIFWLYLKREKAAD